MSISMDDAEILSLETNKSNTTMLLENITINNHNKTVSDFQYYVSVIVPTFFGLICVLGLFGNALVILVVLCDKHMRNSTNILILSLAVSDLLFILFCIPATATKYVLTSWPFGDVFCKLTTYVMYVCAYASVYTLVLMSLDRYLAVVHAIRSMTLRSERNTWIAIFVMWIIILCGNIPLLLQFKEYHYDFEGDNISTCTNVQHLEDESKKQVFYGTFLFLGYVMPLGITVVMYGLMLKRLLSGVVPGDGNNSIKSVRAKKKVTKMVVTVILIFAICWLPIQAIFFYLNVLNYTNTEVIAFLLIASNCMAYLNSCLNPILYSFLSDNFRRRFRIFLCFKESSKRLEYEHTAISHR